MSIAHLNHTMSKWRIIKNVAVLCASVLLLFTAYDGLTMLQSTMNREEGIGVASQAIVYGCFCVSALLLPNYVIKKFGTKMTYAVSMLTYIPYIASNFYPHWSLMIPASILIGLGASLLWGSQATYLNDVSILYSQIQLDTGPDIKSRLKRSRSSDCVKYTTERSTSDDSRYQTFDKNGSLSVAVVSKSRSSEDVSGKTQNAGKIVNIETANGKQSHDSDAARSESLDKSRNLESTTARFFGVHGMSYLTSHLWSNLITYFVLKSHSDAAKNTTVACVCGADYCNVASECFENNIEEPSETVRYTLTGVCVGVGLFAIFLVAVFLDPIDKKEEKDVRYTFDQLLATYRIGTRKEVLLLMPSSFYIGMAQGFYTGDFNKAYIGCAWGTYHVGIVAVCYGACSGLSSSCSGWLVRRLGRVPIFSTAILVDVAAIGFLLLWKPSVESSAMFFVAAGMWGVYVGVFWSHLRAFYGILFKNNEEAAFAAFHVWYSLGFCVSFAYSNYLCISVKLYILLSVCIVGYLGYLYVERLHSKQKIKD